MIRFAMKCAFGLGVAALFVPLGDGATRPSTAVDLVGLVLGAREAAGDLGAFCERAPQACAAAGNVATFAGERVEAGLDAGYALARQRLAGAPNAARTPDPAAADAVPPPMLPGDPVVTGAVLPPPEGYRPPVRPAAPALSAAPAPLRRVPVPTPAPRA